MNLWETVTTEHTLFIRPDCTNGPHCLWRNSIFCHAPAPHKLLSGVWCHHAQAYQQHSECEIVFWRILNHGETRDENQKYSIIPLEILFSLTTHLPSSRTDSILSQKKNPKNSSRWALPFECVISSFIFCSELAPKMKSLSWFLAKLKHGRRRRPSWTP